MLPVCGGGLGVGQFFVASAVVVFFEQGAGLGQFGAVAEQAGAVQVDVGQVQSASEIYGDNT
ncbi:MAG: hypothetical protein HYV60_00820 [Planctomycetia bacterium]|nr:hypothetical protein [Planctomycetia bacterium]